MTAKECFNRITFGRENAVKRLAKIDRLLRGMVEKANNHGDCIINVGNGYYRPTPGDAVEEKELHEYLNKELSRARRILKKRLSMKMTFERWKQDELYSRHSRQA